MGDSDEIPPHLYPLYSVLGNTDRRVVSFDRCGYGWRVVQLAGGLMKTLGTYDPEYDFQHKEMMAELRERRIEDLVAQYKKDITLAMMDEAMQESEATSVWLPAYRTDDFAALGSFFANRIDEYLYRLAEMETD